MNKINVIFNNYQKILHLEIIMPFSFPYLIFLMSKIDTFMMLRGNKYLIFQ